MTSKHISQWHPTIAPPSTGPTEAVESAAFRAQIVAEGEAEPTLPSAVLVVHGIGEEVKFETLSQAASLILTEAKERGATGISVVIRSVPKDAASTALEVRSELSWTEADGTERQVHVYEAYWAPLTNGKVSYWETVSFLVASGWNGLRGTFFSGKFGAFKRWLFGEFRELKTTAGTLPLLAFLLLDIGFFVGIVAAAAYSLAGALKQIASGGGREGIINAANFACHQVAVPWNKFVNLFSRVLNYFFYFPDGPPFIDKIRFQPLITRENLWQGAVTLLLWGILIYLANQARVLLTQYAGSLAAYLSPYKDSKFDDLRSRIQQVGLDAANLVYHGHKFHSGWIPKYEKVVILGHSLGSVIAYDTLNAMINLEGAKNHAGAPNAVVDRTAALITFGSPLDKTAFLFRVQLDVGRNPLDQEGELRETMVCAVQPLIASYPLYRFNPARQPHGPKWINLWSRMDIISGRLDYYDDPAVARDAPKRVQNMIDPEASTSILAHLQYWTGKLLRKTVYEQLF